MKDRHDRSRVAPETPARLQLEDFELLRAGNLVTVQWRGSPKFSIGVLSTLTDRQAFERAAESLCTDVKPGFREDEVRAGVEGFRRIAALQAADGKEA